MINQDSIELKSQKTGDYKLGSVAYKDITLDAERQKINVKANIEWKLEAKLEGDSTLNKILSALEIKPAKAELALSIPELLENFRFPPLFNNIRSREIAVHDNEMNLEFHL